MTTAMNSFVGLSAVLTGFAESVLAPQLDPVDIKSQYLDFFTKTVTEESGDADLVANIFKQFDELKQQKNSDQAIGEAMLDPANGEAFVLACRKLIFMWYSGAWPTIIPATATQPASTVSTLISAESYTSGLAWKVMQSHPMGDSKFRYGYWAEPPPTLADFTGNGAAS